MNCSMEIAFGCLDIWENIFKYFDLKEQLRLTQVCELFHNVITSLIWKRSCKQLKLYAINGTKILVTDQVENIEKYYDHMKCTYKLGQKECKIVNVSIGTSVILDYNEVLELLSMNQNNINKLQIIEEGKINFLGFFRKNTFEKLTTLMLYGTDDLSADNLKNINLSCPVLKTLLLKCNKNKNAILQEGISSLTNMTMLKTLIVNEKEFSYTFNHILNVITNLKHLSVIVLNINIIPNGSDISSQITTLNQTSNLCQLLKIALPHMSPQILVTSLLQSFQQLRVLSMTSNLGSFTINQQFLENLNKSCKHLKNHHLEYCKFEKFVVFPSLETLTFVNCNGMNWWSLKSILCQTNLRSFTSVFTKFSDNFQYFYIESPLEYLRIETVEYEFREEFVQLLIYNQQQMKMLKTLIWCYYKMWSLGESNAILPLKDAYHNLHTLHIDLCAITFTDILEMKCLKQLAFIGNDNLIDLYHLWKIFKHPTLEIFIIYYHNLECNIKSPTNDLLTFTTNLHLIEIPLDMFNKIQNIWFKLLSANPRLQLLCYFYYENFIDVEYLKNLIENKNFPTRIKSIKIGDFTIDCNILKETADDVKTKISIVKHYCNHFNETMYLKF